VSEWVIVQTATDYSIECRLGAIARAIQEVAQGLHAVAKAIEEHGAPPECEPPDFFHVEPDSIDKP